MGLPAWLLFAFMALTLWGVSGLLYKLSTNHLPAESALIWLMVGFFLFSPFIFPGTALFSHSSRSLMWALLAGFINAIATWALLAATRKGGKASVVVPVTSLYPLVVVVASPWILHEYITHVQAVGVLCALVAVVLLSS